jgi:hypothetical protein
MAGVLSVGICMPIVVFAAGRAIGVGQLVDEVASAPAVDRNDKRIARSVKSVQLTERLTKEVMGFLVKFGAGQETARVLG